MYTSLNIEYLSTNMNTNTITNTIANTNTNTNTITIINTHSLDARLWDLDHANATRLSTNPVTSPQ